MDVHSQRWQGEVDLGDFLQSYCMGAGLRDLIRDCNGTGRKISPLERLDRRYQGRHIIRRISSPESRDHGVQIGADIEVTGDDPELLGGSRDRQVGCEVGGGIGRLQHCRVATGGHQAGTAQQQ